MLSFRGLKNLNSASKAFKSDLKWKLLQLPARVYHVYCHLAVRLKIRRPPQKKTSFQHVLPKIQPFSVFPWIFCWTGLPKNKSLWQLSASRLLDAKDIDQLLQALEFFSPTNHLWDSNAQTRWVGLDWTDPWTPFKNKNKQKLKLGIIIFLQGENPVKMKKCLKSPTRLANLPEKNRKILISWKKCL